MSQRILTGCPRLIHVELPFLEGHELVEDVKAAESRFRRFRADVQADLRKMEREQVEGDADKDPQELNAIIANYSARDLNLVRPWVCHELLFFKAFIVYTYTAQYTVDEIDRDDSWDAIVFQQISQLTKLQMLDIGGRDYQQDIGFGWQYPQLVIFYGLERLAPLTDLRVLIFDGASQNLHEEDLQWMVDHFPHLEEISSHLHDISDECDALVISAEEKGLHIRHDRFGTGPYAMTP